MMEILLAPLVVYALLFVLPAVYEAMPREKADLIAGVLYALFLLPSSFYFTFVSAAMIDTFGINAHLPAPLDLLAILLLASTMATAIASIPLLLIRKKRRIMRPVVGIFAAYLFLDLVVLLLFGSIGS